MASRQGATVTQLPARDPFDFPATTKSVTYKGVTYTFRELTVGETDKAREDSTINGEWDGRLMTRLMICESATDPQMTLDQLEKLPQSLYGAVVEVVNDLNDPDALLPKDDPGKS
jgi:hypothetical protein